MKRLLIIAAILSSLSSFAQTQSDVEICRRAEAAYRIGQFDTAVTLLTDNMSNLSSRTRSTAYHILSLCYLEKDDNEQSTHYASLLLKENPYYSPTLSDPLRFADMIEKMQKENLDIVIGSRFVTEKKPLSARMIGNTLIEGCIFLTTGKRIKDPTSGMRLFNRRMIKKLAYSMNYGPEPDTIAYLINCGAKVAEYQVAMNERTAGESYLNFTRTIRYMTTICCSILILQWFRKREL